MLKKNMKKIGIYTLALMAIVLPGVAFGQFGEVNDFLDDISSFMRLNIEQLSNLIKLDEAVLITESKK